MRALKSVKKLPRPSIDNPRLVKRMKSSATMKKPTLKVDKILLASSSANFKLSGDQKEGSEEEEGSSGEIMAKAKSKSKFNKSTTSSKTSIMKDKPSTANTSLNQSQVLQVNWKDSLRDFRKSSLPKMTTRPVTPEMSASAKGSRARRPMARALGSTPARSSARLRQAKQSASPSVGVSRSRQVGEHAKM